MASLYSAMPCSGGIAAYYFWQRKVILSFTPFAVKITALLEYQFFKSSTTEITEFSERKTQGLCGDSLSLLRHQVITDTQQAGIQLGWVLLFFILAKADDLTTFVDCFHRQSQ